jgi:hypothetical protein
VTQVVEYLPTKHETLSSNPNTAKRQREKGGDSKKKHHIQGSRGKGQHDGWSRFWGDKRTENRKEENRSYIGRVFMSFLKVWLLKGTRELLKRFKQDSHMIWSSCYVTLSHTVNNGMQGARTRQGRFTATVQVQTRHNDLTKGSRSKRNGWIWDIP